MLITQHAPIASTAGEEVARNESEPLTVRVTRPFDAETPVHEFRSFLTPTSRFFVRSHFGPPPPDAVSEAQWTLRVGGLVERAQTFTLNALHQMDAITITAVVQCSGNGRAFYQPKVPGVQWERGAVGNAEWTGVRLRDLLMKAGMHAEAQHVQFQGADRPVVASVPLFTRSIPLKKALHPDTILAYAMNGRPLPLLHGAPLRVITPGWMADSCIKWLTEITVQAEASTGYYMETAYRVPTQPVEVGTTPNVPSTPVEAMGVKSLITAPQDGATVPAGPVMIHGVAWSGEATVVQVEVSFDEGTTWEPARLVGDERPYAWRQWQVVWQATTAGTVTILCRATDASGAQQPATTLWNPSGFVWNGWDRLSVTVTA